MRFCSLLLMFLWKILMFSFNSFTRVLEEIVVLPLNCKGLIGNVKKFCFCLKKLGLIIIMYLSLPIICEPSLCFHFQRINFQTLFDYLQGFHILWFLYSLLGNTSIVLMLSQQNAPTLSKEKHCGCTGK